MLSNHERGAIHICCNSDVSQQTWRSKRSRINSVFFMAALLLPFWVRISYPRLSSKSPCGRSPTELLPLLPWTRGYRRAHGVTGVHTGFQACTQGFRRAPTLLASFMIPVIWSPRKRMLLWQATQRLSARQKGVTVLQGNPWVMLCSSPWWWWWLHRWMLKTHLTASLSMCKFLYA